MSGKSKEMLVELRVHLRDWEKLECAQGKLWRSRNEEGVLRGNEEQRLATGKAMLGS